MTTDEIGTYAPGVFEIRFFVKKLVYEETYGNGRKRHDVVFEVTEERSPAMIAKFGNDTEARRYEGSTGLMAVQRTLMKLRTGGIFNARVFLEAKSGGWLEVEAAQDTFFHDGHEVKRGMFK